MFAAAFIVCFPAAVDNAAAVFYPCFIISWGILIFICLTHAGAWLPRLVCGSLITFAFIFVGAFHYGEVDRNEVLRREIKSDITPMISGLSGQLSNSGIPARHLSSDQRERLIAALKAAGSFPVAIRYAHINSEIQNYSEEIKSALSEAGWSVTDATPVITMSEGQGVELLINQGTTPPGAKELQDALMSVGINALANDMKEQHENLILYVGYP